MIPVGMAGGGCHPTHDPTAHTPAHPRAARLVLAATQFLALVDSLMVAVALPAIERELSLSGTELPWVVSAYTLALAGGLLVAGRAGDIYGRRRLLLTGLLGLTVATALAAAAPSGPLLIAARAAQGLSVALAQPASLALVPTLFPREPDRGRTFAVVGIADSLGGVSGALAGGVITGLLGWRWVFLTTLPLVAGALLLAWFVLPESRERDASSRRLDVLGASLATVGITAVVYGIIGLERAGPAVLVALALGVAALGAFVRVERRAATPLLRLGMLRVRSLAGAAVGVAATSTIYSAVVVVGSLYLQRVRGYDATTTGLALAPNVLLGVLASFGGARLAHRLGNRPVALASLLLGAGTLAVLAAASATDAPYPPVILPALLLVGVACYGSWVALVGLAARDVDESERGIASSVFEASIHVGGAFAVAILATTVAAVSDGPDDASGYTAAFVVASVLVALAVVATAACLRPTAPPNPPARPRPRVDRAGTRARRSARPGRDW